MERNELLQKLQGIQSTVNGIADARKRQINIVAQYRQTEAEISLRGAKTKSKATLFVLYGGVLLFFLLQALLGGGGFVDLALFAGLGWYCFFGKSKPKSKVKPIAWGALALLVIYGLISGMQNILATVLMLALVAIVVVVGLNVIRRKNADTADKNAQVAAHNAQVQQMYEETVRELSRLQSQLRQAGEGWYPPSYYCHDAIDFFVNALENFRADNMKELVNLYESEGHRQRMEAGQQALIAGQQMLLESQDRILEGQQAMLTQLKFANVLNMANLSMQRQTQGIIRDEAARTRGAIRSEGWKTRQAINAPRKIRFK